MSSQGCFHFKTQCFHSCVCRAHFLLYLNYGINIYNITPTLKASSIDNFHYCHIRPLGFSIMYPFVYLI